jgi:hypothetical protein
MSFFKYSLMVLSSAAAVALCTPAQAQEEAAPDGAAKQVTWSGSVNYRIQHEKFAGGYKATAVGQTRDDWYQRIMVKLGALAKVNDDVALGIRFSTSEGAAGTAQNLGDTNSTVGSPNFSGSSFGSKKLFYLDLAYLDYRIMDGLNVQAGKAPNMYWSAGKGNLIYSAGESIDGVNLNWQGKGDSIKPFAFGTYQTMANRNDNTPGGVYNTKEGPDVNVLAIQAGATWTSNPMWVTAAVGDYVWSNMGNLPLAANTDSATKSVGNTFYTSGGADYYAYDFNIYDVGLEAGYEMAFAPVMVFVEYATNSASKVTAPTGATYLNNNESKNAMQGGIKIGDAKKTGWWFGGAYREIGADAVVGEMRKSGQPVGGGTDLNGWNLTVGKVFGKGFSGSIDYENGTRNLSGNDTTALRSNGYENMNFNITAEF